MRRKQTRFITSLPVEECFNKIKANVDKGSNTVCTAQRAMAVAIDSGVLCQLNKYSEVDRHGQMVARNFTFAKQAFKPPLRAKQLDPKVRDLNLRRVVGTGEAPWFSPTAAGASAPYADIAARREIGATGDWSQLKALWMCRLGNTRLLLRKVGSAQWFVCVGDICSVVMALWPVRLEADGTYVPNVRDDSKCAHMTLTDPVLWEAMPVMPASPKRRAILLAAGANFETDKEYAVNDSSSYGRISMAAHPLDKARPLLTAAALQGFWDLPPSFLRQLPQSYLDVTPEGSSLLDLLVQLVKLLIPADEYYVELLKDILERPHFHLEDDGDVEI
jgi:hypothetical protein